MVDGDGDDAVADFNDTASTIGSEVHPEKDLSDRPFQEILEVFSSFLPEAVT